MMQHTTVQALGQAHLAELRTHAQRDALARAARQARRASRRRSGHPGSGHPGSGHPGSGIRSAVTAWARRPGPAPESS